MMSLVSGFLFIYWKKTYESFPEWTIISGNYSQALSPSLSLLQLQIFYLSINRTLINGSKSIILKICIVEDDIATV